MQFTEKTAIRIAVCSLVFLGTFAFSAEDGSETLFEPFTGYRTDQFRAPVNRRPEGSILVKAEEVANLLASGALLLDVHPLRVYQIESDGSWLYSSKQNSLPGAIWLPVVAWGELDEWQSKYLRTSLKTLSHEDLEKPIVVFCKIDCWFSWNVAKRVSEIGYKHVYWFADGIDGWEAQGGTLVPVEPYPVAGR